MSESQQPQTHAVHDVDHARHAGVLSERHHALAPFVTHPFVVQQTDILRTEE